MFWLLFIAIIKPLPRVCKERNNSTAIRVLAGNLGPYQGLYKVRYPGFGFFYHDSTAAMGLGLFVIEITLRHTALGGLLCTNDLPVAKTST
jgi:hypothetical protein